MSRELSERQMTRRIHAQTLKDLDVSVQIPSKKQRMSYSLQNMPIESLASCEVNECFRVSLPFGPTQFDAVEFINDTSCDEQSLVDSSSVSTFETHVHTHGVYRNEDNHEAVTAEGASLSEDLAAWKIKYAITHVALRDLLKVSVCIV